MIIHHAFNGLLYAPLFLAKELGFLPPDAQLRYSASDTKAVESLWGQAEENWFAVCDPFAVDPSSLVPEGSADQPCVIAALINRVPFWLFNTDGRTAPVYSEEELARPGQFIDTLVTYEEGTTGHVIGARVANALNLQQSKIKPAPFGREFDIVGTPPGVAILTADVLRLVKEANNKNVIFNYAARGPLEITPFLFTAVITRRQRVLAENLWAAVAVLRGLDQALARLRAPALDKNVIDALVRRFDKDLSALHATDAASKEHLIRTTLRFMQDQEIYPVALEPESQAEWRRATPQRRMLSVDKEHDPIPALLIRKTWRQDVYRELTKSQAQMVTLGTSLKRWEWVAIWLMPTVCCFFFWLGVFAVREQWNEPKDALVYATLAFVVAGVAVGWSVILTWKTGHNALTKGQRPKWRRIGAVFAGSFISLIGLVGRS
jgi:hypothetical protein